MKRKYEIVSEDEKEVMAALYQSGWSSTRISEALNRDPFAVRQILRGLGVQMRDRGEAYFAEERLKLEEETAPLAARAEAKRLRDELYGPRSS